MACLVQCFSHLQQHYAASQHLVGISLRRVLGMRQILYAHRPSILFGSMSALPRQGWQCACFTPPASSWEAPWGPSPEVTEAIDIYGAGPARPPGRRSGRRRSRCGRGPRSSQSPWRPGPPQFRYNSAPCYYLFLLVPFIRLFHSYSVCVSCCSSYSLFYIRCSFLFVLNIITVFLCYLVIIVFLMRCF